MHDPGRFTSPVEVTVVCSFCDFLEMVSRSPWRVLLPPQARCEIAMTTEHEKEEFKARQASGPSPEPTELPAKYPVAIPPPPPALLHNRKPDIPLANTQQHFQDTLRPDPVVPKCPKPLRAHSRSPSNKYTKSPSRTSPAKPGPADVPIETWLATFGLEHLAENFQAEGFEMVGSNPKDTFIA